DGALDAVREALERAGRWSARGPVAAPDDALGGWGVGAALTFRLAAELAERPATAPTGLRALEAVRWDDLHYEALSWWARARALDRLDRPDEARRAYGRFVALFVGSEPGAPSGPVGRLLDEARARAR
ncbi:MAG: hypothetical protein D6701_14690, partial [Gemmatimonadetes bacterium]